MAAPLRKKKKRCLSLSSNFHQFVIVFCFQKFSCLLWVKIVIWIKKKLCNSGLKVENLPKKIRTLLQFIRAVKSQKSEQFFKQNVLLFFFKTLKTSIGTNIQDVETYRNKSEKIFSKSISHQFPGILATQIQKFQIGDKSWFM